MMYRKFITLIAAASVAITGLTAAPARAGGDDVAKIIAGVAVLAIIGAALADNNDNDSHGVTRGRAYNNGYNNGYRNNRQYRRNTHRNHSTNYGQRRIQGKLLPRSCKVQARTRNGRVPAYSGYCLQKNFRYASSLPNQCSFKARTRNGGSRHNVYGRNCLASYGYRPTNY